MSKKEDLLAVAQANREFSKNLYNVLSLKDKNGNVFFSPISAHAALSMAYLGAREETAEAFIKVLNIPDTKTAINGYKEVMSILNNVSKVKLLLANKIFIQENFPLQSDFVDGLQKGFLSETHQLNFAKNVEAAKTINDWVEQKTANKIKDLIQKNDLNALTRLVLVNAIYFKGDWAHKFDQKKTKTEKFFLNETDTVDVQMMNLSKKQFFYKEDAELDAKILELPYTDPNLSLVIILPKTKDGIYKLEEKLQSTDLAQLTERMRKLEVNLKLPKFKVETKIDLNDALSELGLGVIFDQSNANFSGINPEPLYVSKVIQKAFIEVNEEGAEAAAATGLIISTRSLLVRPALEFHADHPFIINLVHKQERNVHILFSGRVIKPQTG